MKRSWSIRFLFLITSLIAAGLTIAYSFPKTTGDPVYGLVYYRGLGLHSGTGFFGQNPYRMEVGNQDLGGRYTVTFSGNESGYYPYRGRYESGALREHGKCYVDFYGGRIFPYVLDVNQGTYYDVNGKLASQVTNGSGVQKLYWENGQLAIEQIFADGYVTYRRRWHKNGQLMEDTPYINGLPHGIQSMYFANGQLRWEGRHDEGRQTGLWRYYNEDGTPDGTVGNPDGTVDWDEP